MHTKLALMLIVVCFAILYPLQKVIEANHPPQETVEKVLFLSSPNTIKQLSFGFDGGLADLYWLRSVQYYGRQLLDQNNQLDYSRQIDYKLLYPLLDITTTLDPQYIQAYRFGALFLPDHDFVLALKILSKGIKNNPDNWRLYQSLGTLYWQNRDYQHASEAFLKGAELPNAPSWLKIIGGVMLSRGGNRATACQLYSALYSEATDDLTKNQMEIQLKRVYALDEVDFINKLLKQYQDATGKCPTSLSALIPTIKQSQEKGSCGQPIKLTINEKGEIVTILGDVVNFDPSTCKIQKMYQIYEP
jgi:tetratricopeptide (TPR) repeat protein